MNARVFAFLIIFLLPICSSCADVLASARQTAAARFDSIVGTELDWTVQSDEVDPAATPAEMVEIDKQERQNAAMLALSSHISDPQKIKEIEDSYMLNVQQEYAAKHVRSSAKLAVGLVGDVLYVRQESSDTPHSGATIRLFGDGFGMSASLDASGAPTQAALVWQTAARGET